MEVMPLTTDEFKPRFSFEVTQEQSSRVGKLLDTHGIKRALFSIILDDVLDMIEQHGNIVVGIILDGAAKPREIVPILNKAERISSHGNSR